VEFALFGYAAVVCGVVHNCVGSSQSCVLRNAGIDR
jgi:hypothetical protein